MSVALKMLDLAAAFFFSSNFAMQLAEFFMENYLNCSDITNRLSK